MHLKVCKISRHFEKLKIKVSKGVPLGAKTVSTYLANVYKEKTLKYDIFLALIFFSHHQSF